VNLFAQNLTTWSEAATAEAAKRERVSERAPEVYCGFFIERRGEERCRRTQKSITEKLHLIFFACEQQQIIERGREHLVHVRERASERKN
jgi:hypothetical protein